jgi:predicted metal-binding membrane protein
MAVSAAQRRPGEPLGGLRAALIATLFVLAGIAWFFTDDRMGGMDAGPGTDPGRFGFWVTAWVVMMAAMMFPSIVPMVLAHARISRGMRDRGRAVGRGTSATFVAGYLLSWTVYGIAAYALIRFVQGLHIDALSWHRAGPYIAGGVIVAAAVYELTPAKDACLRRCRGPMDFVLGGWREGHWGALRLGVEHGAWCVGCCWGLMAALFALGVMSIGWMVFIAALIALEKLVPWPLLANRTIAVGLAALGVAVAFVPERVPGLTLPDSPAAARAMMRMSGGHMAMPARKGAGAMPGMHRPRHHTAMPSP